MNEPCDSPINIQLDGAYITAVLRRGEIPEVTWLKLGLESVAGAGAWIPPREDDDLVIWDLDGNELYREGPYPARIVDLEAKRLAGEENPQVDWLRSCVGSE